MYFLILVIVGELIYFSYSYGWYETGFLEEVVIKTDHYEFHPAKRLWDWIELLIIPIVLSLIAYFLYRSEKKRQELSALRRYKIQLNIAEERSQDRAMTQYFEKMTELILERNLKNAGEDSDVSVIARTMTHILLIRLNKKRKAMVIKYLYKAGLLNLVKN
jgi:hypothetical protein